MLLDNQNHLLENTDTNAYDIIDESLLCDESKSNVLLKCVYEYTGWDHVQHFSRLEIGCSK